MGTSPHRAAPLCWGQRPRSSRPRRGGDDIFPEHWRMKPVMSLGEQEGIPEANVQERGFVGCVGVHQAERRLLGEEHSKEAAASEKTRPWGLLMENLGHPLVP